MEMIVHETESQDFSKINPGKTKNQGLQKILVRSVKRETGQGRTGNDMINGRDFRHEKPGNAGHGNLRLWSGWIIPRSMYLT
jgi:hypothetical protein